MNKQDRIDEQWYAVMPMGWSEWGSDEGMYSGERKMLYDFLDPDEDIEALVGGTYKTEQGMDHMNRGRGVAVATDRRIIFLDRWLFGSKEVFEMPYRSISSITHSTLGAVQINGLDSAVWGIEDIVPTPSAKVFADFVRVHVQAHHFAATPQPPEQSDATPHENRSGEGSSGCGTCLMWLIGIACLLIILYFVGPVLVVLLLALIASTA